MNYFDLLPDNIVEEYIFTHLKSVKMIQNRKEINCALKSVSLVCKRFNQIIADSRTLMADFNIQFTEKSFQNDDKLRPVAVRRYPRCEIYNSAGEFSRECCEMVKIYGQAFEEVVFYESVSYLLSKSVFQNLQAAHTFKFNHVETEEIYLMQGLMSSRLASLKTINIIGEPNSILKAFSYHCIENLKVLSSHSFTLPAAAALNWRLKKLSVLKVNTKSFVQFLTSQKDNLEELEISTNSIVLEFVIREMRDLKRLELNINGIPKSTIFNYYSVDDVKLEELILFCQQQIDNYFIIQLLQHYSMVETLRFQHCFSFYFSTGIVSPINLPNLHTLEVSVPYNYVLQYANIPNLRKLTVKSYQGCLATPPQQENVSEFRTIESLEELVIEKTKVGINEVLPSYPNLKILKLGDIRVIRREFKEILQTLPKLTKLTMKRNFWECSAEPKKLLKRYGREEINIILL